MSDHLPANWAAASFEDIYTLHYGKSLPKQVRTDSGAYPVLGSSGIVGSHAAFLVEGPVIIVGRKGSAGSVFFCKENCWPIDTTYFVKPPQGIDVRFASYQLQALHLARLEKSTAIPGLSRDDAYALHIAIPPTREQHRIVAKIDELFSELDKGIEVLTTAREQLKAYRQSVLKHAFKGKLTEDWRFRNGSIIRQPSELLGDIESYKGSRIVGLSEPEGMPDLPDSWTYFRAEDLCDFITKGTTPSKDLLFAREGEIPFIKVYNLTFSGALDFSVDPTFTNTVTHERLLARSRVYPNDVLMNIVGPPLGKVSVVPDLFPEWNVNQAIAIFRTRFLRPRILAAYLAYEGTQKVVARKAKATAGQFNLTLEICRDIPIPLFDMEEQRTLEERLDQELCTIASLDKGFEEDLARCESLRLSILKQAFSGQLVAQDPKDEPASALLECIRAEREGAPTKNTRNGKNGQKSKNGKKKAA